MGCKMTVYPTSTHYSKHFSRAELNCKCGCKAPLLIRRRLRRLAVRLERLRSYIGPLGITSGYRCKAHNKAVGGAINSQHLYGRAADLDVPHGHQAEYVRAAARVPAFNKGGIGIYPSGAVHVDYRPWRARWSSFIGQKP